MTTQTHDRHPGSLAVSAFAGGYTLVGLTVSTVIAAFVLAGAWMAFSNMRIQWRVSHAERQMDQYAHSAMMEITNILSWAWSAEQVQGGPRNMRWKFGMQDIIEEYGPFDRWAYRTTIGPEQIEPPGGYLTLTYQPTRGLLWNGLVPEWVVQRSIPQYQWGGVQRQRGLATFDRRDRMTVESMLVDFNRCPDLGTFSNEISSYQRSAIAVVTIVMHYRYNAPAGLGLYGREYVRERVYHTQVMLRNWDTENNGFREHILGDAAPGPSDT